MRDDRTEDEAAFPQDAGTGNLEYWRFGMSLRDYFAAKAMQSLVVTDPDQSRDNVARCAYLMADAMLKERAK